MKPVTLALLLLLAGGALSLSLFGLRGGGRFGGFWADAAAVQDESGAFDIVAGDSWVVMLRREPQGRLMSSGVETLLAVELPARPEPGQAVDLASAKVRYRELRRGPSYAADAASGDLEVLAVSGDIVTVRVRATVSAPSVGTGSRTVDATADLHPHRGPLPAANPRS